MLSTFDWTIIGFYFFILLSIVFYASRNQKTSTDYFLAGRNVGFFAIGASIFASNIGSEHIVGLAGQGASTGLAMAHYELHAWIVVLLAWVFVPFYYQSKVFTVETGLVNQPAIKLYKGFGFQETKQWETDHGVRKIRFEKLILT